MKKKATKPSLREHELHKRLQGREDPIRVRLIGCGGNGSQMLTGLARLHTALRALGRPGLRVHAQDPDTVSAANIARQLFSPGDIGRNKAVVLMNRVNAFFGLDWYAEPKEFGLNDKRADIVISCVDSGRARRAISNACFSVTGWSSAGAPPYWMDLGNRQTDGQVVLGCPASSRRWYENKRRLPCVDELFPEILRDPRKDDQGPSCSLAEALQRQNLFVNQAVVTQALIILEHLFRTGRITWHGAFVNLTTGIARPLPVDPAMWARMRGDKSIEEKS